ncbi:variant 3, Phosphopantothenate--cysteine ligase 2 [Lathyrus oleraceus]|uniref:Variant 3, Phosphopantothenate--cysteine ligase 2 n=1 Tax=Pisum sativum TaxID=3888 RepID=A0A9D4X8B6_PEA|nr:variant 3, Phosphopantothenate--cysteine ligase 2 [Pisum sativum]
MIGKLVTKPVKLRVSFYNCALTLAYQNVTNFSLIGVSILLQAVAGGHLLKLPFGTIFEYLQMLQIIAVSMRCIGPRAMFYLAAAVSDYYVLWKDMVEHKIQSGSHLLDVKLVQVPKMLSVLRENWAPLAFCISFKLETDSSILLNKGNAALKKYKMHAVVANELSTRKEQVVVITRTEKITVLRETRQTLDPKNNNYRYIDSSKHEFEDNLITRHGLFIQTRLDNTSVLQTTDNFIAQQPKVTGDTSDPIVGSHLSSIFYSSQRHEKEMGDEYVSVEHYLLAFHWDKKFASLVRRL